MWSQVAKQCQRRVKGNLISLVFSFKVQVRLDSQSSEAERLKEIHKMPSAWSVTCLRTFSQLWLVWLCEVTFSFLSFVFLPHSQPLTCPLVFLSSESWWLVNLFFGSFSFTVLLSPVANIFLICISHFSCQSCVSFLCASFLSKYLILLNVPRKFRLYLLISLIKNSDHYCAKDGLERGWWPMSCLVLWIHDENKCLLAKSDTSTS